MFELKNFWHLYKRQIEFIQKTQSFTYTIAKVKDLFTTKSFVC